MLQVQEIDEKKCDLNDEDAFVCAMAPPTPRIAATPRFGEFRARVCPPYMTADSVADLLDG